MSRREFAKLALRLLLAYGVMLTAFLCLGPKFAAADPREDRGRLDSQLTGKFGRGHPAAQLGLVRVFHGLTQCLPSPRIDFVELSLDL